MYIIHKRQRKKSVGVTAVASVCGQKKKNSNSNQKQAVRPGDSVDDGRLEKLPLVVTVTSPVTFDLWTCFHS